MAGCIVYKYRYVEDRRTFSIGLHSYYVPSAVVVTWYLTVIQPDGAQDVFLANSQSFVSVGEIPMNAILSGYACHLGIRYRTENWESQTTYTKILAGTEISYTIPPLNVTAR